MGDCSEAAPQAKGHAVKIEIGSALQPREQNAEPNLQDRADVQASVL